MPNGRRAAEMIQSDWEKIGVRANIVSFEWGEYLKRIRAGEADIGMLGAVWDYPDPSEVMLEFVCGSPANEPRFCDAAYDRAVHEANVIADQGERATLYRRAQAAMLRRNTPRSAGESQGLRGDPQERRRVQAALSRPPAVRGRRPRKVSRGSGRGQPMLRNL